MDLLTLCLLVFISVVSFGLFGVAHRVTNIIGGVAGLLYVLLSLIGK